MTGKGGDVKITQQKQKGKVEPSTLEIRAGAGAAPKGKGGDIYFVSGDGKEAFRIKGDGTVMINGEKCTHDKELYDAMRAFFVGSKTEYPTP